VASVDSRLELLRAVTETDGVVGHEDAVRALMADRLSAVGEISYDRQGCIFCTKAGTSASPRVMLAAHMDEIGFLVKLVTDEGLLRFTPVGGWFDQVLLAQRVRVTTRKGSYVGVIGSKPPHLLHDEDRRKVIQQRTMFIDIGATSKAQAEEEFGVRPGDPIAPVSEFCALGDGSRLMGKAWDDRVGVALAIEALLEAGPDHPNTLIAAGTVAEEMGLRGATTAPWTAEPDVAIVLESAIAGDVPGTKPEESSEKLGAGPSILFREGAALPSRAFREFALSVASDEGIPVQHGFLEGGSTDGRVIALHRVGVPVLVLGVAARYIHTHAQIIARQDYENALKLLVAMVRRLDAARVESFTAW